MAENAREKKWVKVAIGIVVRDQMILICQRKPYALLGGYWEFPGGKLEAGETASQAAIRELHEELDIQVEVIEALLIIEHEYDHAHVHLTPLICHITAGDPKPVGCQTFKWIPASALPQYQFPAANRPLLESLQKRFSTVA